MSESRPLLKTTPTRQTYLACPETADPFYRGLISTQSRRRHSTSSQSIRQVQSEDGDNIPRVSRSSNHSLTETLSYSLENDTMNAHGQPTGSVAYVQRLETFFDRFSSSLYLENHVAVARDHLANERTFLAWVRTSLSIISIGVAITQLFRLDVKEPTMADDLEAIGRPLGISFIVIGMFYQIFGFLRYFHGQVAMTKGYFPASRAIIIVASTAIFTALLCVFIAIIQHHQTPSL